MRNLSNALLAIAVVAIAGLYVYGAWQQATVVNVDMKASDQSAYMRYAQRLVASGYADVGERNRMPVYPMLQSLLYRAGMSNDEFFRRGKAANIALSVAVLGAVAALLLRFFGGWHAAATTMIVAFTVFVYKAGWFQAEVLFYLLALCLFLLLAALLAPGRTPAGRGRYALAAATGIVAGIAHLTKASILPGLALFALVAVAQAARGQARAGLERLLAVALVAAFFLATVGPYIRNSKRIYGQYLYNVNSTFYIWCDSWEECKVVREAGDRQGWPNLPADQIPSLQRYLRTHTWREIVAREVNGMATVLGNAARSYGYFKYAVAYLAWAAVAVVQQRERAVAWLHGRRAQVGWAAGYLGAYLLLYGWYAPIHPGGRNLLALFLPWLFALSWPLHAQLADAPVTLPGGRRWSRLALGDALLLLAALADAYLALTQRVLVMYGGS